LEMISLVGGQEALLVVETTGGDVVIILPIEGPDAAGCLKVVHGNRRFAVAVAPCCRASAGVVEWFTFE
jgi:hypothetical protein